MDHSFGYNRASSEEDFITRDDLVWSLVDIVAKGGNLLLNVGPRGEDATIPEPQLQRLDWLASFTATHGDALFGTRPWTRAADQVDGTEVRYTSRDEEVFVFLRGATALSRDLVPDDVPASSSTRVVDGTGRG
jgi:alpha-L-fucosidase